jgi:hypothetical protein
MRGSATLNGKRSVWDGIPQAACLVEAKLCAARPGESTHKPVVQAAIGRIPCRLFNIRTKFVRIFGQPAGSVGGQESPDFCRGQGRGSGPTTVTITSRALLLRNRAPARPVQRPWG